MSTPSELHEALAAFPTRPDLAAARAATLLADPAALLPAARLMFMCGRYHDAVAALEAARAPRALQLAADLAARAGWTHQALESLQRLEDDPQARPAALARRLALLGKARDWAAAGPLATTLAQLRPDAPGFRLELCAALAGLHDRTALAAELDRLPPVEGAALLEKARLQIEADRLDAAEATALEGVRAPFIRGAALTLASRLAAWRGDAEAAVQRGWSAVQLDASDADAHCAFGAAQLLQNGPEQARPVLEQACALDPTHHEAHALLAELTFAEPDRALTRRLLGTALSNAKGGFPFATWLLWVRATLEPVPDDEPVPPYHLEEIQDGCELLAPGARAAFENARAGQVVEIVGDCLDLLGVNRSTTPTRLREGRLRRLPLDLSGPRHASRAVLETLRTRDPADVAARLGALCARWPRSPLPVCHRGELHLWLGQADEAERDFRAAIALVKTTRFAWIGLPGVELLRGQPQRALDLANEGIRVMGGTIGPAAYAYRGEVLRRLGRLAEARADLDAAVAVSPTRLSAFINLALVQLAQNDPNAAATIARCRDRAPVLFADAEQDLAAHGRPSGDADLLQHALDLMVGNRASSLIVYRRGGKLRTVEASDGARARLHADDARLAAALRR